MSTMSIRIPAASTLSVVRDKYNVDENKGENNAGGKNNRE